eukprot:gene24657-16647_t
MHGGGGAAGGAGMGGLPTVRDSAVKEAYTSGYDGATTKILKMSLDGVELK